MNKRILHSLSLLVMGGFLLTLATKSSAQTVEIFSGPGTSQNIVTGNSNYHVGEVLYFDSEIGTSNFTTASNAITRIQFSVSVPGAPTTFNNFSLYLKNVPSTTTSLAVAPYSKTGYTQVFSGTLVADAAGWVTIDLTTPFVRTAGNNLQLMTERLDGVARTSPVTWDASTGDGVTITTRRYNGATAPVVGTTSLSSTSIYRPAIRFIKTAANDASLSAVTVPNASSCYSTANIAVTLTNAGTSNIPAAGAAVGLTISGANTYYSSQSNSTALLPGGSTVLYFNNVNVSNVGSNTVQAIVSYAGDNNAVNDSAFSAFGTAATVTTYPAIETAENNPLDFFTYLKTVSGSQAWSLSPGKYKNGDMADSLSPHGGNVFYYFDAWDYPTGDVILYSSCFSLPPVAVGNDYNLKFWMSHDTSYSTSLDSMYVVISTDKGVTWNRIAGFQRYNALFNLPGWQQEMVSLLPYAGQTIQIGFEGISQYGNIMGLDDIVVTANSALPVTLTSFTGTRVDDKNLLTWVTATEVNNTGYEVQRSIDGKNFSELGFVETKANNGSSTSELKYNYTDATPFASGNYYRLKQIDKDGRSRFSNVVFIKGIKSNTIRVAAVYPNPTVNRLNMVIASPFSEKVTFIISDATGKVIIQNTSELKEGDNNLQFNVEALARGIYSVKVICATGCISNNVKFVKQ